MYKLFRLKITMKNDIIIDEDCIFQCLALLYNNGQIEHDFTVVKKNDCYFAFVTAAEEDFLEEDNCSKLANVVLKRVNVEKEYLGENLDSMDICRCSERLIKLYYTDNINSSPICCQNCGKDVPLYRLNHNDLLEDFYEFRKWKELCGGIDRLWYSSMIEDSAIKTLIEDKASEFYKYSQELCQILKHITGKDVGLDISISEF